MYNRIVCLLFSTVSISLLRSTRDIIVAAGVHPGYIKLRSYLQEETIPRAIPKAGSKMRRSTSQDQGTGPTAADGCSGLECTRTKRERDSCASLSPGPAKAAAAGAAEGDGRHSGLGAYQPVVHARPRKVKSELQLTFA